MTEDSAKGVLVGITREELEDRLASAFEHHKGKGYFYNDTDYNDPALYVIIYDKLLSFFDDDLKRMIEDQVRSQMSKPGIHRIMDQGCGHANTLSRITHRFGRDYSAGKFFGYGVSADLKAMWLGHPKWDYDLTQDERELIEKYGIHPFSSYGSRDEDSNVHFFGIEDDIHNVMKDFPYELDLVVSDNTYFHLLAPWMALKRTADKLSVGGIAMVRTLFQFDVDHISQRPISDNILLKLLRRDNPSYEIVSSSPKRGRRVLAVVKRGETDFKTNFHVGLVSEGEHRYIKTFYSRNLNRENLVSIDTI